MPSRSRLLVRRPAVLAVSCPRCPVARCQPAAATSRRAGETVYVPGGWWHAVLNVTDTCAVTQNYVSTANFVHVWKHT